MAGTGVIGILITFVGGPYCRAGSGSESLNIIKNVIYIVGVFIGSICLWVSFDWSELTI